MKKWIVGLLIAAMAFGAGAVQIRGARSCGNWVNDRYQGKPDTASMAWLIGYLSAVASWTEKDILNGTDNDSIGVWMDNYCRANPLKTIYKGADDLAIELAKDKGLLK